VLIITTVINVVWPFVKTVGRKDYTRIKMVGKRYAASVGRSILRMNELTSRMKNWKKGVDTMKLRVKVWTHRYINIQFIAAVLWLLWLVRFVERIGQ
jgi:hypothetical protein